MSSWASSAVAEIRIGAFLQGQWSNAKVVETIPPAPEPPLDAPPAMQPLIPLGGGISSGKGNLNGFGGGVALGYDWRLHDGWLVGVETDIGVIGGSELFVGAGGVSRVESDLFGTVRVRVGKRIQPDWLLYATGGYAYLGTDFKSATTTADTTLHGWTIGGGTEFKFGGVNLFAEYLYADFRRWSVLDGVNRYDLDLASHVVRAGVKIPLGN